MALSLRAMVKRALAPYRMFLPDVPSGPVMTRRIYRRFRHVRAF